MPAPKKITHTDKVSDITKLSAKAGVDDALLQAMTNSEEGFMRVGAMPAITAHSAGGTKQLLDAVAKAASMLGVGFIQSICVKTRCVK